VNGKSKLRFVIAADDPISRYLPSVAEDERKAEKKGERLSGTHVGNERGGTIYLKSLNPSNVLHEMGHALDHRLALDDKSIVKTGNKKDSIMHSECSCCLSQQQLSKEGGQIREYAEIPREAVADGFVLWTDTSPSNWRDSQAATAPREFGNQKTPGLMAYWDSISLAISEHIAKKPNLVIEPGSIKRGEIVSTAQWPLIKASQTHAPSGGMRPPMQVEGFHVTTIAGSENVGENGPYHSYRWEGTNKEAIQDHGDRLRVTSAKDEAIVTALGLAFGKNKGGKSIELKFNSGTPEFKLRTIELAVQCGMSISNPELQPVVQKVKKQLQGQTPSMEIKGAFPALQSSKGITVGA
jgi:hypothetical protein